MDWIIYDANCAQCLGRCVCVGVCVYLWLNRLGYLSIRYICMRQKCLHGNYTELCMCNNDNNNNNNNTKHKQQWHSAQIQWTDCVSSRTATVCDCDSDSQYLTSRHVTSIVVNDNIVSQSNTFRSRLLYYIDMWCVLMASLSLVVIFKAPLFSESLSLTEYTYLYE